MREGLFFVLGAAGGFAICYYLFVDHFAARIEQRVRTVITNEKNKFFSGVQAVRKDVAAFGQEASHGIAGAGAGFASKIADESSKL